jgi:protein TonB
VEAVSQTRTALAVSTLAHLAILGALVLSVRPSPTSTPLVVRLLALPAEGANTPVDVVTPWEAPVPSMPRGHQRPRPASPKAEAARLEAASLSSEEAQAPGPAVTLTEGPGIATETTGAALALASGTGPPEAAGLASGGTSRLGELHRRLAAAAARCYPAAARRFRLQGEVPVHFCLDAAGTTTALSLEGSTGSPLLDRSALECVVPGAQPLSGFEGCFLVPVHFGG